MSDYEAKLFRAASRMARRMGGAFVKDHRWPQVIRVAENNLNDR